MTVEINEFGRDSNEGSDGCSNGEESTVGGIVGVTGRNGLFGGGITNTFGAGGTQASFSAGWGFGFGFFAGGYWSGRFPNFLGLEDPYGPLAGSECGCN